ncbi:hypothetical protein EU508_01060 [Pseudoalteromonas fuliginea]|uniref:Uncharacterized protein n=1 Tax=Pseudoalteromonas fuliginea TaxID=1872678 RepID=A0AB73BM72_9GAMM|nr:hypothetical protein [Pseudoalteromonas fuliginea]KAA1164742.1 hypothetical protein EU508_01060 [Pseudoalteromonas fuliginea]
MRRYFNVNETPVTDITNLFHGGMNLEQLNKYTKKITSYKKAEETDGESGSSSGSFAFESVLAVSKSKKKATLVPLYYFKAPAPKKELKPKQEYKPPSPF